jgi:hypothetical protein
VAETDAHLRAKRAGAGTAAAKADGDRVPDLSVATHNDERPDAQ